MSKSKLGQYLSESKSGRLLSFIIVLGSGMCVVLVGALLILVWKKLTKTEFPDLGFAKPQNWLNTVLLGVFLGIVIKLLFTMLVMPIMGHEPGVTGTFDFLKGNLKNALLFSCYVIVVGGFSEELIFRGFFFHHYERWFGNSRVHQFAVVIASSLIFGIPHFYQGGLGVIQSVLVGSIFGTMYLINKRNIWVVVISHAVFDLVAIYITYHDLAKTLNFYFFH